MSNVSETLRDFLGKQETGSEVIGVVEGFSGIHNEPRLLSAAEPADARITRCDESPTSMVRPQGLRASQYTFSWNSSQSCNTLLADAISSLSQSQQEMWCHAQCAATLNEVCRSCRAEGVTALKMP